MPFPIEHASYAAVSGDFAAEDSGEATADFFVREMYDAVLAAAGHAVAAVEDGIDALRYVEKTLPNLIVRELALPRLAGHDVKRELASRAETRDIPIVVVVIGFGALARADPRWSAVPLILLPQVHHREWLCPRLELPARRSRSLSRSSFDV